MIDNNNYLNYLRLKEGLKVFHKGYDLKYSMSTDFVFYSYRLRKDFITKAQIYKCFFLNIDISEFEKALRNRSVIFTNNLPGLDHQKLVDDVMGNVINPFFFNDKIKIKIKINFKNIIVSFYQIFFNKDFSNVSFYQKTFFAIQLVFFKNLVDQLEKLPKKVFTKSYVACFNGNNESIYTIFFQKRNIKTYCLQHGLLTAIQDYKYFIPADIVSNENLNCDYMLGWGDYTKIALRSINNNDSKFLLAGAPKYSHIQKIIIQTSLFESCIVCLARDIYFEGNIMLLEIANEMINKGINVHLKFHPRSDMKRYDVYLKSFNFSVLSIKDSINDSIANVKPDFVIVYNSTVYYEYYFKGIIAFRYSFQSNDIPFGLKDEFSNFEELIIRIEEFENKNREVLTEEVNTVMNQFCALGINNYGKILNT